MKSFIVSWHADGYCGSFNYNVVANNLAEAKEIWKEFAKNNSKIEYSWHKAEKGVKNHHGGYITWKEDGNTDKEAGCYEMAFDAWNIGSDHLRD